MNSLYKLLIPRSYDYCVFQSRENTLLLKKTKVHEFSANFLLYFVTETVRCTGWAKLNDTTLCCCF